MPKIGMPSSAMIAMPWVDALKVAIEHKFDGFEIGCEFTSAYPDNITPEMIEEAQDLISKHPIEISVHAPFLDFNLAAYQKQVRDGAIGAICDSIDFCAILGGNAIVVHGGYYTAIPIPRGKAESIGNSRELQWNYNIDALKQINDYADTKGVIVALENVGYPRQVMDKTIEDLIKMREAVGESLQFTLDFGHSRLTDSTEKAIQLMGENIRHIHITDNLGLKDDHLPVGDGNLDYTPYLDFLREFPHLMTLELVEFGTDPGPVLKSRDNFLRMLKE